MSETAWSQQYSAPLPQKKNHQALVAGGFESKSVEEVKIEIIS